MTRTTVILCALGILTLGINSRAEVLGPTPVALSGQLSPAGGNFASFRTPVLNEAGQIAFYSTLSGTSAGGIFAGNAGSWQSVATLNGAAPGGGSYTALYGPFAMNTLGQVVFHASTDRIDNLFAGAPGAVQLVAQLGGPAPGGGTYNDFDGTGGVVALNDSGQVAFSGEVQNGNAILDGVFAGIPGAVQAVAKSGTPAPGGGTFSTLKAPLLNAANQVTFQATVLNGPSTSGVFLGTSGSLEPVAFQGAAAPGGGTYSSFSPAPEINSAGQVAFRASLSGTSSSQGIFAGGVGSVQPVALLGTPAPRGGNYGSFFTFQMNGDGAVSFLASVVKDGTSISGLFEGSPGAVATVAMAGDNAPGGAVFNFFSTTQQYAMNPSGQLVFAATLVGSGVDTTNDQGLYAGTPGNLIKIVREGDTIDVDPGPGVDNRIVKQFAYGSGSGQDGHGPYLNDAGLFVYELSFTDGTSGIFTSYIGTPPQSGDFNHDGVVDAADYVAWRKGLGVTYSQSDYDTWRTAFAQTIAASGTLPNARAIPEPSFAVLLLLLVALSWLLPLRLRALA